MQQRHVKKWHYSEGSKQLHALTPLPQVGERVCIAHLEGGWLHLRASLDTVVKTRISLPVLIIQSAASCFSVCHVKFRLVARCDSYKSPVFF